MALVRSLQGIGRPRAVGCPLGAAFAASPDHRHALNPPYPRCHASTAIHALTTSSASAGSDFHHGSPMRARTTSAAALLAGLWVPHLALAAAVTLIVLMAGAVAMHFKVKDPAQRYIPALAMLAMSTALAVMNLG